MKSSVVYVNISSDNNRTLLHSYQNDDYNEYSTPGNIMGVASL